MSQLALILFLIIVCDKCAPEPAVSNQLKDVWLEEMPDISQEEKEGLRDEAWEMFDFGWKNYIRLAFPRDNLLPLSCKGQDWQGGMSITLLDALDTFLLMNRKEDMEDALRKISQFVHFDMDTKVHVFEVVIRVLGGLLSGHLLLERSPEAFPKYDGILLDKAIDVAQRLRPAFDSRTGLPYLFVNLRKGKLATLDKNSNTTCTACAGTLLLEFGHLSALTGDPQWAELAEHAAEAMFDRRSSLGLVGGSINVDSSAWVSREATTGPGVDSYYEYLLKSYLMFGNLEHLQMFTELYGSVMQQLQPPSYLPGNAFLVSAHMDSGRLSRTFVSSLAAFWPAMQALVGLEEEAVQLHEGFLSAWREFGWLPELFGLELEQIDPHDPGYQLRPESIESNYILYALTQDPKYLDVARRIQRILNTHNRVKCGFASINNVTTGDHSDIQESYFLSETVKYLYLTFVEGSGALLDYFIFSTEGHLLPPQPPADQEAATAEERVYLEAVAESRHESKCTRFCETQNPVKQAAAMSKLQQAFPLLHFDAADAELIQRRRCVACTQVTKHMGSKPAADSSLKIEQLSSAIQTGLDKSQVLSQILCLVDEHPSTQQLYCSGLRSITIYDIERGLPENAVMLQLSWIVQPTPHAAALFVAPRGRPGGAAHLSNALVLPGAAAEFGPSLVDAPPACAQHLLDVAAAWAAAAAAPTAPSEGSSEAVTDPSVTAPSATDPSVMDPSEGSEAHDMLQVDSVAEVTNLEEVTSVAEVLRSPEGAATTDKSLPSGPECAGPQPPPRSVWQARTGRPGQADSNQQSQSGPSQPPAPVCVPLSPFLGGLLPQAAHQLVAAVQAAMLGGSCSATGADTSRATGAVANSAKGVDSSADSSEVGVAEGSVGSLRDVQAAMQGESCSATGADSSADSSEERGSLESAQAPLEEAGGGGVNREAESREKTDRGTDSDQRLSEGVWGDDLCMDGRDLEPQQQQQQQQQQQREQQQQQQEQQQQQKGAKHLPSQAEAEDDMQECAARFEGDLSEGDYENMGDHVREGDSGSKAGGAGGLAEHPQQQQHQQAACKQDEDASGGGNERDGPPCADTHEHCADWALKGECSANPSWMWEFCPAACRQCTPPSQAEKTADGAAQKPTAAAVAGSTKSAAAAAAAAGAVQHGHEVHGARQEQGTRCEEQEACDAQHAEQEKQGAGREEQKARRAGREERGPRGERREEQAAHGARQNEDQEVRGASQHGQVQGGQAKEHNTGPLDTGPPTADPHSWGPCERVPLPHGPAILADPPDACVPSLYNAHLLARAVVVMVRGGCAFAAKAQAAEAAGAAAFVVLSPSEEEVVVMGGMADAQGGKSVWIPGMLLGRTPAILLLREMHTAAVHGVPWPEVTLALDSHAQGARERSFQEGQLADQQSRTDGRVRSRPGSQQLGMLVPTSSIRYIQKLIMMRNQDIQSMLMDIVADDEALLLLLQIARESGPNSPTQIQKRQSRMQNDRTI